MFYYSLIMCGFFLIISMIFLMGSTSINEPQNMPWNQRTSLFAEIK